MSEQLFKKMPRNKGQQNLCFFDHDSKSMIINNTYDLKKQA